jgi:hypothetical protein
LYDVHSVHAEVAKGAYIVKLIGGDGSETYAVTLVVKAGQIVSRTLTPGDAASWSEKTTYRAVID